MKLIFRQAATQSTEIRVTTCTINPIDTEFDFLSNNSIIIKFYAILDDYLKYAESAI